MIARRKIMNDAWPWPSLLALAITPGVVGTSAARADETNAKNAVKKMSDYMAAQKAGSKLGLASSGLMKLNRPDKIRATRSGGFANVEYVFIVSLPFSKTIDRVRGDLECSLHLAANGVAAGGGSSPMLLWSRLVHGST
jgi:hypothetical protein